MATRNYSDLSNGELIRLLEARDRQDATRFGLVWEANEVERDRALNQDFVALDLDPLLSAGDAPWRNLIIEGDNFDALRYLRMTFAGRVKCIYIDPPYNTGNRDFIYNDRFVEKEDLWRHSKWVEFMYQRLALAKNLLREDGVIFVSIDDNELFGLGLLMNQVFGEGNSIATVIWQKRYGGGAKTKHVVSLHEYVLCYALNKEALGTLTLPPDPEARKRYKFRDAKLESRGPYFTQPLATTSMDTRPNLRYPIPFQNEEIWPEKQWQWSKERTMEALANDELVFSKSKGKWSVRYKQYLRDSEGEERGAKPMSIVVGPYTQEGTDTVKRILGDGKAFTFPKPPGLVEHLLSYVSDKDALVLDFFAGSGTTAHAVHKLNAEDGGHRRCILVSNAEVSPDAPEKNLCRDVCAERVRRVIGGYTSYNGEQVAGTGGDFAYLTCRRIPQGRLTEIDHAQFWTALQLIHCETVSPYQDSPCLSAGDQEQTLLYVPSFRREHLAAIRKAVRGSRAVILYSWQPELLRQHIRANYVQFEHIPESLARRFGLKG